MIPKIIHYCWFGKGLMPKSQKDCIKSWQKIMPDYKIMRWDETNFDINFCDYTTKAYKAKKYAFVADVARLQALYNFGGIYLDTDVEIFKRLDNYLDVNFFSAIEVFSDFYSEEIQQLFNGDGTPKVQGIDIPKLEILASLIGSVPKNILIGDVLDFYKNIEADEEYMINPEKYMIFDRVLARFATKYGFKYKDEKQLLENNMIIYPTGIFGYAWSINKEFDVSYHYNAMSWEDNVSAYTRKRRTLDKYHLLGVYERFKKIKNWIKNL